MKNLIFFFSGILFIALISASTGKSPQTIELTKATANAETMQGLIVFIHCEPAMPYKYLGTYAPKVVWSKDAKPIIEHMIKKGKEEFPQADAIIFRDDEMGVADMVKMTDK